MKAAIHTRYGSPNVLHVEEIAPPSVGDDQVLVQVHACPITQGDRRLRAADFPGLGAIPGRLMFGVFGPRHPTPGTNFAGRVVATGANVTRFAVGDDVFGSCDHSAFAETLAVDEDGRIATIPEGFDYDEAAALSPYGAGSALVFLRDIAELQPGQRVLIVGAAGGVGRCAVQIARHLGAEVTGVCSGRDMELVRRLGAAAVIDYEREDFTRNGETYDVIFDTAAGDRFSACRSSLTPTGRYVTVYLSGGLLLRMLMGSVLGGQRAASSVVIGTQKLTEDVAQLMTQGVLSPVIAASLPLDELVAAQELFENDKPQGVVIVRVSDVDRYPARKGEGEADERGEPSVRPLRQSA